MNAAERVNLKESQILYKKIGRKYVQVNDPCAYDGLKDGWWLIHKEESSTSIRAQVFPNNAELDAAMRGREQQICDIVLECTKPELEPKNKKEISEECQNDWQNFLAKHGSEFSYIQYPSPRDFAAKVMEAIIKKV
jgi:hypothetical protein